MKKTLFSNPAVLLVSILGVAAFCKLATLHAQEPKPVAKGDIFRSVDDKETITVTSADEMEVSVGGMKLNCKYTQQGAVLSVVVSLGGEMKTVTFKVVPDGLTDPDGLALFNPTALKTADKGGSAGMTKRQIATKILEDLRLLDAATDQYALETNKVSGMNPSFGDLKNYLKTGSQLYNTGKDLYEQPYGPFTVDSIPKVSEKAFNSLSDIADANFWSPFH